MKDQTCQERVKDHYEDRISDLHKLWQAYSKGEEEVEDLGNIFEYGLAFDYVPFTEDDDRQEPGYFRYQLSTGGPGDEFRFFCDAEKHCYRVEYWFLDWYVPWDDIADATGAEDPSELGFVFGVSSTGNSRPPCGSSSRR